MRHSRFRRVQVSVVCVVPLIAILLLTGCGYSRTGGGATSNTPTSTPASCPFLPSPQSLTISSKGAISNPGYLSETQYQQYQLTGTAIPYIMTRNDGSGGYLPSTPGTSFTSKTADNILLASSFAATSVEPLICLEIDMQMPPGSLNDCNPQSTGCLTSLKLIIDAKTDLSQLVAGGLTDFCDYEVNAFTQQSSQNCSHPNYQVSQSNNTVMCGTTSSNTDGRFDYTAIPVQTDQQSVTAKVTKVSPARPDSDPCVVEYLGTTTKQVTLDIGQLLYFRAGDPNEFKNILDFENNFEKFIIDPNTILVKQGGIIGTGNPIDVKVQFPAGSTPTVLKVCDHECPPT